MTAPARFVTLEGIDGAGKSSHVEFLRERIAARGVEVVVTREPGGTDFGRALREVILHHRTTALAEARMRTVRRAAGAKESIRRVATAKRPPAAFL